MYNKKRNMMQGELSGEKVMVAEPEADILGKGYGRKKARLELSLEEAGFLLETGKIEIKEQREQGEKKLNFKDFLNHALDISPKFGWRYIVYRDLKERGYAVQPGGVDFWLYPRGAKPGEKPAKYFIRILSERDMCPLKELDTLLILARNMRKEPIIAVVDEESDVTYYEVKEARFEFMELKKRKKEEKAQATLLGDRVILWDANLAENLHRNDFYGKLTKEKRLLLSLVEAAYLMKKSLLEIEVIFEQFLDYASSIESDFMDKYAVYEDLREKGLIVKTGFKFGSHFRVYKARQQKHSLYLIHVLPEAHVFSMSELSRAIRLAHGVKKRMVFSFREKVGEGCIIRYVDVGRMKL